MRSYFLLTAGFLLATTVCRAQPPVALKKVNDAQALKLAQPVKTVPQTPKPAPDPKLAILESASLTIRTGSDGKENNTHYGFVLFDANSDMITSFHDNNSPDPYAPGSTTPSQRMRVDSATFFGILTKGGRFHISIIPQGNASWQIAQFTVTLDFVDPKLTKTMVFQGTTLSPNKKEADVYFTYDGNNFVPR